MTMNATEREAFLAEFPLPHPDHLMACSFHDAKWSAWQAAIAYASSERASAEKDAARLLAKLIADMDEGHRRQIGSPHHAHSIAGIWDSDNGVRAGKPCEQCAMWNEARALVAAMNAEPDHG